MSEEPRNTKKDDEKVVDLSSRRKVKAVIPGNLPDVTGPALPWEVVSGGQHNLYLPEIVARLENMYDPAAQGDANIFLLYRGLLALGLFLESGTPDPKSFVAKLTKLEPQKHESALTFASLLTLGRLFRGPMAAGGEHISVQSKLIDRIGQSPEWRNDKFTDEVIKALEQGESSVSLWLTMNHKKESIGELLTQFRQEIAAQAFNLSEAEMPEVVDNAVRQWQAEYPPPRPDIRSVS